MKLVSCSLAPTLVVFLPLFICVTIVCVLLNVIIIILMHVQSFFWLQRLHFNTVTWFSVFISVFFISVLLHICFWSHDGHLVIVNVMRGCHFEAFSSYILTFQLCWYSCWCGLAADLILAGSKGLPWNCISSRGKVILLCFSSELLGLEEAPAWVRSQWSSVGLLNVKWMIWYVLLEK